MVGFEASSAYDLLPRSLKVFRERFPNVDLALQEMLLPEHVKQLHRPGVVFRPVAPSSAQVELAVAWRREDTSQILRAFLDSVRECARDELTSRSMTNG